MKKIQITSGLRGGTALSALVLASALFAAPAMAQDTTTTTTNTTAQTTAEEEAAAAAKQAASAGEEIVVTGSLFRRTDTETPSPVTIIRADDLATRGINTIEDAIQNLSANGAGTLPNSFSANGAFAAGASAASLRGLTTSSTLVLFDGLRAAYYPLADDGQRNFVDLNTIPDAIVDRVEILKDGASSTYGADAVAGVVNIITKKQVVGFHATAEAGVSQRGDAATQRLEATYGYGDLVEQGFNVYASGHYYKSAELKSKSRGFPYNTDDLTSICNSSGGCLPSGVFNGRDASGAFTGFSTTPTAYVRPYNATNTTAQGRYQILNAAAGCGALPSDTLTAAEQGTAAPAVVCVDDRTYNYGIIQPEIERYGGSARGTVQLGSAVQAYGMFNFERSHVSYTSIPTILRATTSPAATGTQFSTASLALPVYVCASGVGNVNGQNGCTAANGTLNPNNPFAANNQVARLLAYLPNMYETADYRTDSYRGALGVSGTIADTWDFSVDVTAMEVKLRQQLGGRIYVANMLSAIATGNYNFVNPFANTAAQNEFIAPTLTNNNTSRMYQGQVSLAHSFFDLPGGPLQVGVGASIRREEVFAPSANPDRDAAGNPTSIAANVDPTQRYLRVNPFGAQGKRTVYSAYGEISAPIIQQVELQLSGRYDDYSSGQSNFSPKAGIKVTPIKQLALRATYSRGFRIPSFAEAGADPTTGYIPGTNSIPAALAAQYGANNSYITNYSLGLTQVGNPNLQPEKSRNFTVGAVFEPVRNVSFTVDYYNIKKTNVITGADYNPALRAYYAGQPIPAGFTVIPDVPDVNNPTLLPRIGFIQYSYINANEQQVSGIDFTSSVRVPINDDVTFSSSFEASYLIESTQTFPDGTVQHYEGTLGPYIITSGSGSPRWRGSWQNTLEFGGFYVSGTAYYTKGYSTIAEDAGGVAGDCDTSQSAFYDDGTVYQCSVKDFINVNMAAGVKVNDQFSLYLNVNNLFDAKPPIDTATYGAHNYNPAWANAGIIGRSFRVGAKVNF